MDWGGGRTDASFQYGYDHPTRRVQRAENGALTQVVFSGGTSVQKYLRGSDKGGDEWMRYCNLKTGTWLSRDPIGEEGGLNLYGYVGNNPINAIDPLGLWSYFHPSTWFDGQGYQPGWIEDGVGQASQATLDGIIPFVDPFVNNGGYDPCDKGLAFSRGASAFARDVYGGRLFSGAFSAGEKSLFWSGGIRAEASMLAQQTGLKTLEQTLGGRALTAVGNYLPEAITNPLWKLASANFAANATGTVHVASGSGMGLKSIWATIEYPILKFRGLF